MTGRRVGDSPELPAQPAGPVVPALAGPTGSAGGGRSVAVALYDVEPDTIAAIAMSCPAVACLSGGPFGAAATYLPGRTVPGVQISPGAVQVHVVGRYGIPVTELADQVRRALSGQVLGRRVDIVVEDLTDPPSALSLTPATAPEPSAPAWPAAAPAAAPAVGMTVGWPPATTPLLPGPR